MKIALTALALLISLSRPCLAQGGEVNEQKSKLVEQKIRLVEMLVNSPAAKSAAAGRDAESVSLLDSGRQQLDAARKALAENRPDEASKLLDAALKSVSGASRKISPNGSGLSDSAQKKSLADLAEQVATYRASVQDLTSDAKLAGPAKQLLARVDALSNESRQLAAAGQLGDANKKLASAYKVVVEQLSAMRAGHEVVLSLKFETPADEFAYEQKRFSSNLVMIDMLIREGRADGQKRVLVDTFINEGHRIKALADTEATAHRHKEAVVMIEKATAQLNRALQSMGVPIY